MLRVIIYQGSISIVVALVFLSLDSTTILPSIYGGVVSIINTLLLARSVDAAGKAASEQERTSAWQETSFAGQATTAATSDTAGQATLGLFASSDTLKWARTICMFIQYARNRMLGKKPTFAAGRDTFVGQV